MIDRIDEQNIITIDKKPEYIEIKEKFLELISTVMNNQFSLKEYFEDSSNLNEILKQVEELKKYLDSFRPLGEEQVSKLDRYFEEYYTYDSTSIEGNTLTLQETTLVLNKGITIGGKSMREHLEVINHSEAIEYIKEIVKKGEEFNKKVLLDIHYLILKSIDTSNSGKYRNLDVMISGSKHKPPTFLQVENLMNDYFKFYQDNKEGMNPILLSAYMHEKLVTIHPFIDGNGRTSRLVMNLILLQNGYPITNISSENDKRNEYYSSLENVQTNKNENDFLLFIAKNVKESLIKYLEVISMNGELNSKGQEFYQMIVNKNKI
jgi:Fic family protein